MPDHSLRSSVAEKASLHALLLSVSRRLAPWLTAERAIAWCGVLLVMEFATLLVGIMETHGWFIHNPAPSTTDFSSFYAAGRLADHGPAALAYNIPAHYAEEQRDTSVGVVYNFFYYPPMFLMLCALLGRLPYIVAFLLFEMSALALYLRVALLAMARHSRLAAIGVLSFPANFWNIGLGQNGFLTAGLFGYATLLVDERPLLSGMLFGCLTIKPHFGLLVPVALVVGRHWRAFAGAALSSLVLAGLSLLWFGPDTWRAFINAFIHSPSMYQSGEIGFNVMVSVFGAVRLFGFAAGSAYATQAVVTVTCVIAISVVWGCRLSLPVRAATLLSATVASVPLILFYDMTLVGIALAWLLRRSVRPLSVTEKLLTGVVFAFALSMNTLTYVLTLPVGLMATAAVLGMALCRAAGEIGERRVKSRRAGDGSFRAAMP